MRKQQVQIGGTYVAKVSNRLAEVRIVDVNPYGGWSATNTATGHQVHIKSAQRLRREVPPVKAAGPIATMETTEHAEVEAAGADDAGPQYDPTRCATKRCRSEPVLTLADRPLCQACWERHCEEDEPVATVADGTHEGDAHATSSANQPEQENNMARKTTKKAAKQGGTKKTKHQRDKAVPLSAAALADSPVAQANAKSWEAATPRGQRGGTAKAAKKAKPEGEKKPKRVSALDAAATVLRGRTNPMNSKDLITAMDEKGLWKSPGGKTPHATLYAAILREINEKKGEARFKKVDRGLFASNKAGA